MAAGDASGRGPPREKVKDVISHFRASKRFWPDSSKTHVTSLDFDDTGELTVASRTDNTLQIYNIKEGKHAKELKSQKYGVDLARFSHHSQSIIFASTMQDDTIRYLSTHDNSFIRYFRGHTGRVTCLTMSPANDDFMSCSQDGTVRLWSVNSQNARGWLNLRGATLAAYDPSASVMAIASGITQSLLLYDSRNFDKQPFSTFDLASIEGQFDSSTRGRNWTKLEFSNDGKRLLIGTSGGGHLVLDSFEGTLQQYCRRPAPSQRRVAGDSNSNGIPGQGDVCFSPDGQFLVGGSGNDDGLVAWDLREPTGDTPLKHFAYLPLPEGKKDRAEVVAYNPRFNMICSADRGLSLWAPDKELYSRSSG